MRTVLFVFFCAQNYLLYLFLLSPLPHHLLEFKLSTESRARSFHFVAPFPCSSLHSAPFSRLAASSRLVLRSASLFAVLAVLAVTLTRTSFVLLHGRWPFRPFGVSPRRVTQHHHRFRIPSGRQHALFLSDTNKKHTNIIGRSCRLMTKSCSRSIIWFSFRKDKVLFARKVKKCLSSEI